MRGRLLWRLGLFFALLFMFSVGGCTLLFWLVASLLGVVELPNNTAFLPTSAGIVALIVVAVGVLLVGRALRRVATPLGDVMEAAGRVAAGDYSVRVAERGPREVRALARAFNTMTSRLQTNEEQRRNLMADVAHELRTPLAVIQGNLEGLLDSVYPRDDAHLAPILDETRVLSRLIEDLRTLALAESGTLKLQKESTDLAALIGETLASFRAQADAAGIVLSNQVAEDVPLLEVDPTRIREVLTNLIANALRYTPRGGTVHIRCSLSRDNQRATVVVSDNGVGITAADLPHIFDRFYKSRDSRGTGLGLTIAKNLIAAHGGEIFASSETGRGTTISFTLPLAD